MITPYRWHHCLIIYTGIGHHNTHAATGKNKTPLKVSHLFGLTERIIIVEIHPARIRDHWNGNPALFIRQSRKLFYQLNTGQTDRLGISHHVCLTDSYHVSRIKHTAYLNLVFNCPLPRWSVLAVQHTLCFCR